MRKFMACICAAALSASLVACGGTSGSASSPAQKSSLSDGKPISVDFKGWKLELDTPQVVWSEYEQSDLFVIHAKATNNTGKEAKFEDVNNLNAIPENSNNALDICEEDELALRKNAIAAATSAAGSTDTSTSSTSSTTATTNATTTAAADTTSGGAANASASATSSDTETLELNDGTVYQDIKAGEESTKPGESIDLTYSWKLDSNYGTVRVNVQAFSASKDNTSITYTDIIPTEEFAAYQTTQEIIADAQRNATEVNIKGATVYKPNDWYLEGVTRSSVDAKKIADSKSVVRVQFITTAESARDRALKYAANYKLNEQDVQTAVIGGVEWFYFSPMSTQFQAYAQATDGIINVGSTVVRWEDAEAVMNNVTIH